MAEKEPQKAEEEIIPTQEVEVQPQAEMSADFEDPEGKSGKWKTVKGEVEIEGKKVEVSYREKVIELPKHRQQETGIKRIRRKELLPPFPNGIFIEEGEENPDARREDQKNLGYSFWRSANAKELEPVYKFLTEGIYPSSDTWTHMLRPWRGVGDKDVERHKKEGIYFQKIFPETVDDAMGESLLTFFDRTPDGLKEFDYYRYSSVIGRIPEEQLATFNLFCRPRRTFNTRFSNPVFVFGNKNSAFVKYVDSVLANNEAMQMIALQNRNEMGKVGVEGFNSIINGDILSESSEPRITCVRHPDIKPLRWCHSEIALVPTKRSLNVLFFETGDEDKKEEK